MLGGSAVIPDELRDTLWKINPHAMYGLEKFLDELNVAKKITKRDLGDHMRLSFINWGKNLALEGAQHMQRALDKQWKETEDLPPGTRDALLAGRFLWEMPWALWGFGGSPVKKAIDNFQAAQKGEKDIYAFDGERMLGKGKLKHYGFFDAFADSIFPGSSIEAANYTKKKHALDMFKQSGRNVSPKQQKEISADYPTPNVEE